MRRESGFQIVELLLFLGITSLLLAMAMFGVTRSINTTRAADARNSLVQEISGQYSDVRSGVSFRPSSDDNDCNGSAAYPGGSNGCIVIGRLLAFTSSGEFGSAYTGMRVYTIIASRCPDLALPIEASCPASPGGTACPVADSLSDAGLIAAYCPRVITTAYQDDFTIPWGSHIPTVNAGGTNPRFIIDPSGSAAFDRIAIIRSPTSERVFTYFYAKTSEVSGETDPLDVTTVERIDQSHITSTNADKQANICLQSDNGQWQYIRFSGGQGAGQLESGDANTDGGVSCS